MSGQPSKQAQERMARCRSIPKRGPKREGFKRFWRRFTLFPDFSRRHRRDLAIQMWREGE